MIDAVMGEFPFVEALPKREKSKLVKLWDRVSDFRRVSAEEGGLVTVMVAGRLLDVTRSRVDQLCDEGHLRVVRFEDHVFISASSIEDYAKQEKRKAGRPRISSREIWDLSLDASRKVVPQKK